MVVDPKLARAFVAAYTGLLTEAHRLVDGKPLPTGLAVLASGREAIGRSPDIRSQAIAAMKERGAEISPEIWRGIQSLRFRQWVYLKDTSKYSVFIDPEASEAYAVVGLNGPVRGLLGGAEVTFRSGVVELGGRYVCDGILESHAWLGPSDKREYRAMFKALQSQGRWHVTSDL